MNISIVGDKGLANTLGKKGTSSDITLYNTSFQGRQFTFIEPNTYPEKIQTLFQAINISHFVILYITSKLPKKDLGESIIAIDMLKISGLIVFDDIQEEEIKSIIKGTSLENFPMFENDSGKILEFLSKIDLQKIEGKPKVVIDHSFLVKSVGIVALGTVWSGEVKKHDKLMLYPSKIPVMIKSIQINDKDYEKATCYDRVGLVIKGVEVHDLKRGFIISNSIECTKEIKASFIRNVFFKEDIPKNAMAVIGLQYNSCELDGDKILFSKEVAFDGESIVILSPDKKMRIVGIS